MSCWQLGKVRRFFWLGVCGSSHQLAQLAGTTNTYPKQFEQIVDSASPHVRQLGLVFTEKVAVLVTCGYENYEILWIFLYTLERILADGLQDSHLCLDNNYWYHIRLSYDQGYNNSGEKQIRLHTVDLNGFTFKPIIWLFYRLNTWNTMALHAGTCHLYTEQYGYLCMGWL